MAIIVNGTEINLGGTSIKTVYAREGENSTYILVFQGETTTMIYYAGNWKMNMLKSSIDSFFAGFNTGLNLDNQKKVIIFPPACYLEYVKSKISPDLSSIVEVGIQNISAEQQGSYTGQISAQQAKDCGCTYALIGHSEVKSYMGDTIELCNQKIDRALQNNLKVIYCIGEDLQEYENEQTQSVIESQLSGGLLNIAGEDLSNGLISICYEPVWALGTGKTCTPQQLQFVCEKIRQCIADKYGQGAANNVPLYSGGSVKPTNIQEIISKPDINGVLAAGSSLKVDSFLGIIEA